MIRRPPRSTRTDTLFPYTTLFRSLASHFIWRSTANMAFLGSLTGSLPGFELPTTPVEPRFTGLTAIFTGGLDDDWVKAEHVRATAERFGLSGADVSESIQALNEHGIDADEIALLRDSLIACFGLNPPMSPRGPKHHPLVALKIGRAPV